MRETARKILFQELEKSGWQWVIFNEECPAKNNGIVECVLDAMEKFKTSKIFKKAGTNNLFTSPLKKIPIIISKSNDDSIVGWRAEIADNFENYKTSRYEDINFEDLTFHFESNIDTHAKDSLLFYRRKDAIKFAKYINKQHLNSKAKIWFVPKLKN